MSVRLERRFPPRRAELFWTRQLRRLSFRKLRLVRSRCVWQRCFKFRISPDDGFTTLTPPSTSTCSLGLPERPVTERGFLFFVFFFFFFFFFLLFFPANRPYQDRSTEHLKYELLARGLAKDGPREVLIQRLRRDDLVGQKFFLFGVLF
jgi:hypothetical protein